ncbi:MAG: SHOCT domain-containing protein [Chloroflexi bacterium]|nr:SHOCT domain-containing protein [Chloroflexota bacterium]
MMGGLGFGMFGIGAFMMLAFWALVIGGAVWLVATLVRGTQGQTFAHTASGMPASSQAPLDNLKMRYANGEITKEQFDELKRDLSA